MKIVKMCPQKFRNEILNISLDDGQTFKSHQAIVQIHKLEENSEITPDFLEELKREGELWEAREYATLSLSLRDRSVEEITQKLRGRKFSIRTIHILLEELKDKKLLNDSTYAKNYVESKIHSKASDKIEEELILKGVPEELVREAIRTVGKENKIPTEEERAFELLRKRAAQIRTQDSHLFYRRIYDYLSRRGFTEEIIESTFSKYKVERGGSDESAE